MELPAGNKSSDKEIISFSEADNRIVITKDNDFLESFLINKKPSRLVIVKTGNIRNADLFILFDNNLNRIVSLLGESSLIEFGKDEIIVHVWFLAPQLILNIY